MNPRQEILQLLFDSCVFEGNFSELARTLGYTSESRSTIERVRRGRSELTAKTLDALYDKIKEEYIVSDSDIATIAQSVAYAKNLYAHMRDLYGTGDEWHNLIFGILVTENYTVRPEISEELITELKELKLQEPEIYYGMLAHFFIISKGISPYTKREHKQLATQLYELNDFLHELYPGSNRSYESAKESIKINLADEHLTILKLIYNFRHIIRGYVDNNYYENFLREMGTLLNVGNDSFWIAPGETFHEGCELWYLGVIPTKSQHHGAYTAMRLKAKTPATDSFELTAAYNIMFIIDENYGNMHIMQAYEISTGKVEYALFSYDESRRLLELNFEEAPARTFNLPEQLECINHTAPTGKNEKVWANITGKLLNEKCFKFILAAANSSSNSNIEYLVDYDVTNVCIDRKQVTVTIKNGEEEKCYSIPIDSHPFFKELTPFEFASVVRYKNTNELAVAWNNLGLNVPLKEFAG